MKHEMKCAICDTTFEVSEEQLDELTKEHELFPAEIICVLCWQLIHGDFANKPYLPDVRNDQEDDERRA